MNLVSPANEHATLNNVSTRYVTTAHVAQAKVPLKAPLPEQHNILRKAQVK